MQVVKERKEKKVRKEKVLRVRKEIREKKDRRVRKEKKDRRVKQVLLELVQAQQIKYLKMILRLNVLTQEQVLLK